MDGTTNDAQAWEAVLARDGSRDGEFVYAVATTGIYCRPSCPSRRPRRRNVQFFPRIVEAERAGFRACRRCRPNETHRDATDAAVEAARRVLEQWGEGNVTLEELAAEVGVSPFHLQRRFKERTGMSPREYSTSLRLARFRHRVREGDDVAGAAYEAGFGSSRGLYTSARAGLGMTPGRYARGGAGLAISWSVASAALGRVLVASTDEGICAVLLGDDDEELAGELRHEFPRARLVESPAVREDWMRNVLRHLDDTCLPLAVPLDFHGTPFQIRVWKALRDIPPGERRSYADVAAAVGSPQAVRAVGSACARNAVAVLVPCHRVTRKDGAPGSYRWGPARKVALLAREVETEAR